MEAQIIKVMDLWKKETVEIYFKAWPRNDPLPSPPPPALDFSDLVQKKCSWSA